MSFKQSFLEIDGCRINLRRGGSGEALVFLHGASLTKKNLELFARDVMPRLKALG